MHTKTDMKWYIFISLSFLALIWALLYAFFSHQNYKKWVDFDKKMMNAVFDVATKTNQYKSANLASTVYLDHFNNAIDLEDKKFDKDNMIHISNMTYYDIISKGVLEDESTIQEFANIPNDKYRLITFTSNPKIISQGENTNYLLMQKNNSLKSWDLTINKEQIKKMPNILKAWSLSWFGVWPFTLEEATKIQKKYFPQKEIIQLKWTTKYILVWNLPEWDLQADAEGVANKMSDLGCKSWFDETNNWGKVVCVPHKHQLNIETNTSHESFKGKLNWVEHSFPAEWVFSEHYTMDFSYDKDKYDLDLFEQQWVACDSASLTETACSFKMPDNNVTMRYTLTRLCKIPTNIEWMGITIPMWTLANQKIRFWESKQINHNITFNKWELQLSINIGCEANWNITKIIEKDKEDSDICPHGYEFDITKFPNSCIPKQHNITLKSNIWNEAIFKNDNQALTGSSLVGIFWNQYNINVDFDKNKFKFINKTIKGNTCENNDESCAFTMKDKPVEITYQFARVCIIPEKITFEGYEFDTWAYNNKKIIDWDSFNLNKEFVVEHGNETNKVNIEVKVWCLNDWNITIEGKTKGDTEKWCSMWYNWENWKCKWRLWSWGLRKGHTVMCWDTPIPNILMNHECSWKRTWDNCQITATDHLITHNTYEYFNWDHIWEKICTKPAWISAFYEYKGEKKQVPLNFKQHNSYLKEFVYGFKFPFVDYITVTQYFYKNCLLPSKYIAKTLPESFDVKLIWSPIIPFGETETRNIYKKIENGKIEWKITLKCNARDESWSASKNIDLRKDPSDFNWKLNHQDYELENKRFWNDYKIVCDKWYHPEWEKCVPDVKHSTLTIKWLKDRDALHLQCHNSQVSKNWEGTEFSLTSKYFSGTDTCNLNYVAWWKNKAKPEEFNLWRDYSVNWIWFDWSWTFRISFNMKFDELRDWTKYSVKIRPFCELDLNIPLESKMYTQADYNTIKKIYVWEPKRIKYRIYTKPIWVRKYERYVTISCENRGSLSYKPEAIDFECDYPYKKKCNWRGECSCER